MNSQPSSIIPVCRPLLPTTAELAPYLARVDAQRWYSNFGPLNTELTQRLATHAGAQVEHVVTAANATAALTCVMLDYANPEGGPRPRALMPAWTFVATPQAATLAGLEPYFADVDPVSWQITPAIARSAVATSDIPVAVVVVVGPFGAPVETADWEDFAAETGIAVIIDAAAGFDSVAASKLTTVVSLHATKALPAGEGAFVLCRSEAEAIRLKRRQNFGFHGSRTAEIAALNAKMSEYHAAVGLAALDQWTARRAGYARALATYRRHLPGNRALMPDGLGTGWITATMVIALERAREAAAMLFSHGIETRAWWADGCHLHPAFTACPRTSLPATRILADTTLGLPLSLDLPDTDIEWICGLIAGAA
ncbi:MAG: DegT/DnrJ/EryC1/StrS aminotransferase [Dechloromonas sp.]|nr:MAG: DegT/DnrJ/EryC1/StrS aminotransferase [Dechloromonas sp.]